MLIYIIIHRLFAVLAAEPERTDISLRLCLNNRMLYEYKVTDLAIIAAFHSVLL